MARIGFRMMGIENREGSIFASCEALPSTIQRPTGRTRLPQKEAAHRGTDVRLFPRAARVRPDRATAEKCHLSTIRSESSRNPNDNYLWFLLAHSAASLSCWLT